MGPAPGRRPRRPAGDGPEHGPTPWERPVHAQHSEHRPDPAAPRLLVSLATTTRSTTSAPSSRRSASTRPTAAILVIDDNSPDGTGRLADELKADAARRPRDPPRRASSAWGRPSWRRWVTPSGNGYDYVLNMDADFSHPPRYIPALLAGMRDHDVMIGSRYIPGGGVEGEFNLKRKFMSTGINLYARLFLGLKTKDNSGSFRCYRVSKLAEIDFGRVRSRGYSFMEEILFWCREVGCRFGETPILFENRRAGVTKINKSEAVMALKIIAQLGVDRALGKTRSKAPTRVTPAPRRGAWRK